MDPHSFFISFSSQKANKVRDGQLGIVAGWGWNDEEGMTEGYQRVQRSLFSSSSSSISTDPFSCNRFVHEQATPSGPGAPRKWARVRGSIPEGRLRSQSGPIPHLRWMGRRRQGFLSGKKKNTEEVLLFVNR